MGYEYTVNFATDTEVYDLLKSLPYFESIQRFQGREQFIYRLPENQGQLPSGLAEVQDGGVYFCDYGGGNEILKELIFRVGLGYKKLEVIDHSE